MVSGVLLYCAASALIGLAVGRFIYAGSPPDEPLN